MDLNINKLKEDLLLIYETYTKDKHDFSIKSKSAELYSKYKDVGPMLDKNILLALNNLVDIAYETGKELDVKYAKEILQQLKL